MSRLTFNDLIKCYNLYIKIHTHEHRAKVQARVFRMREIIKLGLGNKEISGHLDKIDKVVTRFALTTNRSTENELLGTF